MVDVLLLPMLRKCSLLLQPMMWEIMAQKIAANLGTWQRRVGNGRTYSLPIVVPKVGLNWYTFLNSIMLLPLNHIIVNSWKCKASLTIHESGWLVYRFLHEEDKLAVLSGGPYLVYGRPLILKSMPEFFDFSTADMSTVPVWIKLPNLPLQCWSPVCLSKIGSVLGKPVQCDVLTSSMSRLSFARILVEIDLLADLKHSVKLALPNGTSVNQKIVYETLPRYCKHCRVIGHNTSLCPHSLDKKVASAPITAKVVEAVEKGLVKRWVPVKKVIPDQVKPIEQQLSDEPYRPTNCEEPSRPTNCEEAFRPTNCGEHFRPNDMQVSSPLNESLDEQRVDPMQMETDAGEWTIVKRRNGKSKVANDNAVVVSSLGDPASMVGIDVDPLCGVTTRSGIRRSGDLARSKGLKALAPVHLC
ncbi:MILDEW RESISTANCE LOCUS [Salix suchowensis]|nr:MILDEW RESISTANCE LOCUS [Salix suchowensis]